MQKLVASALLVLFVAGCIDAQGRGRMRGRGRRPGGVGGAGGAGGWGGPGSWGGPGADGRPRIPGLEDAEVYKWDVESNEGTLIPQRAFVHPEKDAVVIVTISKDMRSLNMTPSVIAMNPNTGIMVIKQAGRRTPCFLSDFTATKIDLENDFAYWNDTTIIPTSNLYLNGTEEPLTREEMAAMMKDNIFLARICRGGRVIRTSPMIGGGEDPDTTTLQLLGYDSQISLMVPEGSARRGPPAGGRRGPPGGFPGRGNGGFPGGRNGGSPRGNGGFPRGNGGFPRGNGGSPRGNGGSPRGNGGFPRGNGGFPRGNGGFPRGNGGFPGGRNGGGRGQGNGRDQDQGDGQGQGQGPSQGRGRGDGNANPQ